MCVCVCVCVCACVRVCVCVSERQRERLQEEVWWLEEVMGEEAVREREGLQGIKRNLQEFLCEANGQ